MHPRMVMHPFKSKLDGKDLSNVKDPNGKRLFVAFVNAVKADGGGRKPLKRMVPRGGIEPPTRGFSIRCAITYLFDI